LKLLLLFVHYDIDKAAHVTVESGSKTRIGIGIAPHLQAILQAPNLLICHLINTK